MTVSTNGSKAPPTTMTQQHTDCCAACASVLAEVHASQLRTEAMVNDFIQNMAQNPMFKMMAGKFGGR